jgi:hypothetical protein
MELRKIIATTIREYLNESINNEFNENQKLNAKNLFKDVFDYYLKKVSPKTYPMIYHCTSFDRYESIKIYGLTGDRNYFLEDDNNMNIYGFNEEGEEEHGIACGINYKDVINRLYPDPEWLMDVLKKTGNPSRFKSKGISDDIILCYWVRDSLGLDLNQKLNITDINKQKLSEMIRDNTFYWLYVKGKVNPNLITIKIHPDFNNNTEWIKK